MLVGWVGQATLAVLAVLNEVLFSGVVYVVGLPPEQRALFLRVYWHASFGVALGVGFVWMPAELVVLAFLVSVARFVLASLEAAEGFEWPPLLGPAVQTHITVAVLVALLVLLEPSAEGLSLVAVGRLALKARKAVPAR